VRRTIENKNRPTPTAVCSRSYTALSAVYEGLVEKAWYSAFRNALSATTITSMCRSWPSYSDAKVVVGFITILWQPYRSTRVVPSCSASGQPKLRVSRASGKLQVPVERRASTRKTALSLFLAREHKYPEALSLMHDLYPPIPQFSLWPFRS